MTANASRTNPTLTRDASISPRRGGELVIDALVTNGVDTVFGIPGVHTLALYDALHDAPIRHVLARHEQGVGFMADGYSRASGRPGVAVVITGPGITNIATPVGQAYTDSSPVLVISSNVERAYVDGMRGNLHDLKNQLGVMAAVTEWNERVSDASAIPDRMTAAFERLRRGRRLPVHLEFPLDVLDELATVGPCPAVQTTLMVLLEDLNAAVDQLIHLRRVVIYAGGGAVSSVAHNQIRMLAERLGAPVITSIMGKGAISEDHPLAIGALWRPGNAVDDLMWQADGIVVVGSKLGYQATDGFRLPIPPVLIWIDVDPAEMVRNAIPTIGILADAAEAVGHINQRLQSEGFSTGGFGELRAQSVKEAARAAAFGIERVEWIDALRRAIPSDGILVNDMTMMSYVACGLYPVRAPRTFMFPSGYGTLGFALPVAIGAKIARPEAAVVAVCGDGGYQFSMAELGTAIQERLGLPVVIFNDSTYSAVKEAQHRERDGRYLGVDLVNPDYVKLADAYGIPGIRANDPLELERSIGDALARQVPTLIDVPIEPWVP